MKKFVWRVAVLWLVLPLVIATATAVIWWSSTGIFGWAWLTTYVFYTVILTMAMAVIGLFEWLF